jgi:predicted site-specific integrase-resolvase
MTEIVPTTDALTEAEVAERLSVSTKTLQRWRLRGMTPIRPLPGLGRLVRYASTDVVRYLAIHKGAR